MKSCRRRFRRRRRKPESGKYSGESWYLRILSADKALKKDFFIETANKLGSAFADPDVAEPAVYMEGVEVVFDF